VFLISVFEVAEEALGFLYGTAVDIGEFAYGFLLVFFKSA